MAVNFMVCFVAISMIITAAVVTADSSKAVVVGKKANKTQCVQGWECRTPSIHCCKVLISDIFDVDQFERLFSKRNSPAAQAVGFWDYISFINAAAVYEPLGFGTTGGRQMQLKELAAFLAHVATCTSCGNLMSVGGPLAWGLCFNREMSPSNDYCDHNSEYNHKCISGVQYYGRGAITIYGNDKYGWAGQALKVDLLHHPEYLEQNATLAFQVAMWMWMSNSLVKGGPSAHDAFVGNWKPTKIDTMAKRVAGFGTTINVLNGDTLCGKGDIDSMNNIISHYQYYLDLMGVGRENGGPYDELTCAEQLPFIRADKSSS